LEEKKRLENLVFRRFSKTVSSFQTGAKVSRYKIIYLLTYLRHSKHICQYV